MNSEAVAQAAGDDSELISAVMGGNAARILKLDSGSK